MTENERIISATIVCQECGIKYGAGIAKDTAQKSLSTWHEDTCDICGEEKPVTEFRDFGHAHPMFYKKGSSI